MSCWPWGAWFTGLRHWRVFWPTWGPEAEPMLFPSGPPIQDSASSLHSLVILENYKREREIGLSWPKATQRTVLKRDLIYKSTSREKLQSSHKENVFPSWTYIYLFINIYQACTKYTALGNAVNRKSPDVKEFLHILARREHRMPNARFPYVI